MSQIFYLARVSLVFVLIFLTRAALAQTPDPVTEYNKVSISSPTAGSLAKFVDIPVSLHTGVPEITIPLYTIKEGSLSVPVSISYHASGIKSMDPAGWIGTGWALNAGGVITRSVRGTPDEKATASQFQKWGHFTNYGYRSYLLDSGYSVNDPITQGRGGVYGNKGYFAMYEQFKLGYRDGEPDLFFFNVNGYSGKFYFNDDRTPMLLPEQDIKIEYEYTDLTSSIQGFILTVPNGDKYYFGKTADPNDVDPVEYSKVFTADGGPGNDNVISSWYLNKVVSADGFSTINLTYQADFFGYHLLSMVNGTEGADGFKLVKNYVRGVRLDAISSGSGQINFVPASSLRLDLSSTFPYDMTDGSNTTAKALGRIDIKQKPGLSLIKSYLFNYDYFVDNLTTLPLAANPGGMGTDKKRLKLLSIQEQGATGILTPPYLFDYFDEMVPRRLTLGQDHWGFINGVLNNQKLISGFKTINGSITRDVAGAYRETVFPAMRGGTLKKITFPTKGYNLYEFEPNQFYTSTFSGSTVRTLIVDPTVGYDGGSTQIDTLVNIDSRQYVFQLTNSAQGGTGGLVIFNSSNVQMDQLSVQLNDQQEITRNYPPGVYKFRITKQSPYGGSGTQLRIYALTGTVTTVNAKVGGLRIRKITQSSGTENPNMVTSYDYNELADTLSSGILFGKPTIVQGVRNDIWKIAPPSAGADPEGCFTTTGVSVFVSPTSTRPMESTQGYHIGYHKVKTSQTGNGYSISLYNIDGGSDVQHNDIVNRIAYITNGSCTASLVPNYPAAPLPYNFARGELNYKADYSNTGQLLKDQLLTNDYQLNPLVTPGIVVAAKPDPTTSGFFITWYNQSTGRKTKSTEVNRVYNTSSGILETKEESYFNSPYHHQLTSKVSVNSTGDTLVTRFRYAQDHLINNVDNLSDGLATYNGYVNTATNTYNATLATICLGDPTCRKNAWIDWDIALCLARKSLISYRRAALVDPINTYKTNLDGAFTSANAELRPIIDLRRLNNYALIETVNLKNNKVLNSNYINYEYFATSGNKLYPSKVSKTEFLVPQTTYTYAATGTDNISVIKDSRYIEKVAYKYTSGNVTEMKLKDNVPTAYQWSANLQYPLAVVKNAVNSNIFYEGFEDAGGNSSDSKTGHQSYVGTYSKSLIGLTAGTYTLSYWTKAAGLWTLTSSNVTVSGSTYTINTIGNQVDDVRFCPVDGQMTTYTYDPAVGITSTTDTKNMISYYEYDDLQRLVNIKDQWGNIVKNYCYNYAGQTTGCAILANSSPQGAAITSGSFVSSDLLDNEWKQEAPPGYSIASDNGTTINAAGNAGPNAGRFAYYSTAGTVSPLVKIDGKLSFTAKGSGTIEVRLIATYNYSVIASKTFALTSTFQNYTWDLTYLYPQLESIIGVIVNGGSASPQASVEFKKNFSLNLYQLGLTGAYQRFRADSTSLIGNAERNWYGWKDSSGTAGFAKKKYLQHSAYARMRFQTSARKIVIEYVRDMYDKKVVNIFPYTQAQNGKVFDGTGAIVPGSGTINNATRVTAGQSYTIQGLKTTNPTIVWFQNGAPLGAPVALSVSGTYQSAPLYQVTAPANATNLGLLVQNSSDTYVAYTDCMIQLGAIGSVGSEGTVPTPYVAYAGDVPVHISGPAVFINGNLYKYYQVEGNDQSKVVQFVTDTLPAGLKTVEVMMPGQGTYNSADPHVRRTGTFLRAVYFDGGGGTSVMPAATVDPGSIVYIHDSILSGYNISEAPQNNVWMMKTKRDPLYGFAGDIFSEGYAGRILYTDVSTPALTNAFAAKLASFNVDKYWFQIGVNDYGFETYLPNFYSGYKNLIEQLKVLRPNAKMYIQSTGPENYEGPTSETRADDGLTVTGPTANDYRDVQRVIGTSHSYTEFVNFEGLFDGTSLANLSDGVHPTDAGNAQYALGIKNKSTLLGTTLPVTPLAFYRSSTRNLIQSLTSIYTITATGGKSPYGFTLLSGNIPAGMTFNTDGTITGTPSVSGTFPISVKVTDANAANLTQSFTVNVNAIPTISVFPARNVNAQINVNYAKTFKGRGGYGPYSFVLASGAIPAGMSFNGATGLLFGAPTATGTSTFSIKATDKWGFSGITSFTLNTGTGTPPALTDAFTLTATVSADNHLWVTGHLTDYYTAPLFTYAAAFFTPSGRPENYLSAANVNVAAGLKDGVPVDMGAMGLPAGMFSVRLNIGSFTPSTIDGVNLTYNINSTQSLTTSTASPTEQLTLTAYVNSSKHLILTSHIPTAHSVNLYASVGANANGYFQGGTCTIPAGLLDGTPQDVGLVTAPSGPLTITLFISATSPNSVDGKVINYTSGTSAGVTVP